MLPGYRVLHTDTVWHDRLLAATCQDATEWVILAPDLDLHAENFVCDVRAHEKLVADGARPVLVEAVCGILEPLSFDELQRHLEDARLESARRACPTHNELVLWDVECITVHRGAERHAGGAVGRATPPRPEGYGEWLVTNLGRTITTPPLGSRLSGISALYPWVARLWRRSRSRQARLRCWLPLRPRQQAAWQIWLHPRIARTRHSRGGGGNG